MLCNASRRRSSSSKASDRSWPRCWSGWSCARPRPVVLFPPRLSRRQPRAGDPRVAGRPAGQRVRRGRGNRIAEHGHRPDAAGRAGPPGSRVPACHVVQSALHARAVPAQAPACCCPERRGSTAAVGKWSIRGWNRLEATARWCPGASCRCTPLTEGLQQPHLRRIVRSAVEAYAALLDEVFPAEYLDAHDLLPIQTAVPRSTLRATRRAWRRPGAGSSTRNCWSCNWPWPCGSSSGAAEPDAAAGRQRQDRRPDPPPVPLRV